ncbi:hypothetical protein E2562_034692 [Oryza meyeriana var. granulata]|uniref:Integrase catalytic domain-containing protein n=1 Tax=Oryza meyeriana var. granulata TaxID=110450 RepID=A0A6G1C2P5_9ORYZ|nr:hypothetical protein E2562_034692 [Oryza meyeriana var. granulata]
MACVTCQQYKADHLRPAGLLQPLPVPSAVWADIGIDFIEALPKVQGKTVILSVVDRFSKYCHFIPLAHPYTAESVAHAFFADIAPARPAVEEVEALALAVYREERARVEVIAQLRRSPAVPNELFYITQEMHRALAGFQCREQKHGAARLLELEALHAFFDDLI